jgi:hypothetical protein
MTFFRTATEKAKRPMALFAVAAACTTGAGGAVASVASASTPSGNAGSATATASNHHPHLWTVGYREGFREGCNNQPYDPDQWGGDVGQYYKGYKKGYVQGHNQCR